jgi:hypothetical protein
VTAGAVQVVAELNDSVTAEKLWAALPMEAAASTWGDEIYFQVPLGAEEEDAREVVDMGAVAYWPPGSALCLFFGPTPASRGDEIRPASAVNVVGKVVGDPTVMRRVRPGERVVVEEG